MHGFSDASEEAYAGVVYLRSQDSDGNVHIALVAAKSKVAPIHRLTIPRLAEAEAYWLVVSQQEHFATEVDALEQNQVVRSPVPYCNFANSWMHLESCVWDDVSSSQSYAIRASTMPL